MGSVSSGSAHRSFDPEGAKVASHAVSLGVYERCPGLEGMKGTARVVGAWPYERLRKSIDECPASV